MTGIVNAGLTGYRVKVDAILRSGYTVTLYSDTFTLEDEATRFKNNLGTAFENTTIEEIPTNIRMLDKYLRLEDVSFMELTLQDLSEFVTIKWSR